MQEKILYSVVLTFGKSIHLLWKQTAAFWGFSGVFYLKEIRY